MSNNKHHLSKENIDSDRGKSLDVLMGDELHDPYSAIFLVGLSLGVVEKGITSWKDFVYGNPDMSEAVFGIIMSLVDKDIIFEVIIDGEPFYKHSWVKKATMNEIPGLGIESNEISEITRKIKARWSPMSEAELKAIMEAIAPSVNEFDSGYDESQPTMGFFDWGGVDPGDGECFCWEVSKETYRKIAGEQLYKLELELRQEEPKLYQDEPWRVYPSDVLPTYEGTIKFNIEATPCGDKGE